jgi:hypothetical protein
MGQQFAREGFCSVPVWKEVKLIKKYSDISLPYESMKLQ